MLCCLQHDILNSRAISGSFDCRLCQDGSGVQARLAMAQNIDRGYLNAVIKRRKPAAGEIRLKIADHCGMLYVEMLTFGRRVQQG